MTPQLNSARLLASWHQRNIRKIIKATTRKKTFVLCCEIRRKQENLIIFTHSSLTSYFSFRSFCLCLRQPASWSLIQVGRDVDVTVSLLPFYSSSPSFAWFYDLRKKEKKTWNLFSCILLALDITTHGDGEHEKKQISSLMFLLLIDCLRSHLAIVILSTISQLLSVITLHIINNFRWSVKKKFGSKKRENFSCASKERWDAAMWSNAKTTKAKERFSLRTVCKVNAKLNMNVIVCMPWLFMCAN